MYSLWFSVDDNQYYLFKMAKYDLILKVLEMGFEKYDKCSESDRHKELYTHKRFPNMRFEIVPIGSSRQVPRCRDPLKFINDKSTKKVTHFKYISTV